MLSDLDIAQAATLKKIESINKRAEIRVFINQYEKSKSQNSYMNQLLMTLQEDHRIYQYLSKVMIPKSIFFKQLNDNMLDEIPQQTRTRELLEVIKSFLSEVK